MKKHIKHIFIFGFSLMFGFASAQVGIGTETPHASTVLDVVANDKAFLAPRIHLLGIYDVETIEDPAEGMLVYNTNINPDGDLDFVGYYFFDGEKWVPTGIGTRTNIVNDGVVHSILGYAPSGYVESQDTVIVDGVTFERVGCKTWSGNGHRYCAYKSGENGSYTPPSILNGWTETLVIGDNGVKWGTAFKVGEAVGGYLVTPTSLEEWDWIYTNIIQSGTGYNLANHIWLGNAKAVTQTIGVNQAAPGVPVEFFWITGEQSKHNWGNTTTLEHNYANNEPNNLGDTEGCTHTWGTSHTSQGLRGQWNDAPCTVTIWNTGGQTWERERRALNQLIIEFED